MVASLDGVINIIEKTRNFGGGGSPGFQLQSINSMSAKLLSELWIA